MSNGEAKRWETISIDTKIPGTRFDVDDVPRVTVISADDHERIAAGLKAQLEHSETKVSWLLRDNERVLKEKDAAYNELDDINMALNEKIAKQARVIEKLKTYIQHRVDCICRAGVLQYSDSCDCGLKAIEKEGA